MTRRDRARRHARRIHEQGQHHARRKEQVALGLTREAPQSPDRRRRKKRRRG